MSVDHPATPVDAEVDGLIRPVCEVCGRTVSWMYPYSRSNGTWLAGFWRHDPWSKPS